MTNTNQAAPKSKKGQAQVDDSVRNFPHLPDTAEINRRAFQTLIGVSQTQFFRLKAEERIPKQDGLFGDTWKVGTVRAVLNGEYEPQGDAAA